MSVSVYELVCVCVECVCVSVRVFQFLASQVRQWTSWGWGRGDRWLLPLLQAGICWSLRLADLWKEDSWVSYVGAGPQDQGMWVECLACP